VHKFPSTAALLTHGSDPRLHLDPVTGANHYLCRPQPDADVLRLGSSTATTISPSGFAIAEQLRDELAEACLHRHAESVCQEHAGRICQALHDVLQLDQHTAIELAESGTDVHRRAVRRIRHVHGQQPLRIVMVAAAETGSGVPDALCRPWPEHTQDGAVIGDRNCEINCSDIAIRDADGMPLSASMIDADVVKKVEQAMARGEDALLVMVDQSKSGCVAPSLSCGLDLRRRYPDRVHLLLDACQFRFSRQTLHHYLEQGIMVAITGSKFLAGPSFSGALLVPGADAMSHYPLHKSVPHPGLLIRWQVALTTLASFSALDDAQIHALLNPCGHAIEQYLVQSPVLAPLPTPVITRPESNPPSAWDQLPTIFPFRLRVPSHQHTPPSYASYDATMSIYQQLQQGEAPHVQLGRPIVAGQNHHQPIGALRLCISAAMVIDAITDQQSSSVIDDCLSALDRVHEAVAALQ